MRTLTVDIDGAPALVYADLEAIVDGRIPPRARRSRKNMDVCESSVARFLDAL